MIKGILYQFIIGLYILSTKKKETPEGVSFI